VLRRLDCVLESTKPAVLAGQAAKDNLGVNKGGSIVSVRSIHLETRHAAM